MSWMGKRCWTGRRASIPEFQQRRIVAELGRSYEPTGPSVEQAIAEIDGWEPTMRRYDAQPSLGSLLSRMGRDAIDLRTHDVRPVVTVSPEHAYGAMVLSGVFLGPQLVWVYKQRFGDKAVTAAVRYQDELAQYREAAADDFAGSEALPVLWIPAQVTRWDEFWIVQKREAASVRKQFDFVRPVLREVYRQEATREELDRLQASEQTFARLLSGAEVYAQYPNDAIYDYVKVAWKLIGNKAFDETDLHNLMAVFRPEKAKTRGKAGKPSTDQLDALRHMLAEGNLRNFGGGAWTTRAQPTVTHGAGSRMETKLPAWYAVTVTVKALENRGWIERAGVHAEAWKDERKLTDLGRQIAEG